MKTKIGLILVCVFSLFLYALSEKNTKGDADEKSMISFASLFLNNIKADKMNNVKSVLFSKIKLGFLKKDQILKLADDMMMEQILISEYILKISGHSLQQFLNKIYKLVKISEVQSFGIDRGISDKNIINDFCYVKFKISFQYKYKGKVKTVFNKLIEIDLVKEEGKYKVFGFML